MSAKTIKAKAEHSATPYRQITEPGKKHYHF